MPWSLPSTQPTAPPAAAPAPVHQPHRERWLLPAILLLAFILLAFILRVYHLDFQSLWRDETDAVRFATQPLSQILSTFTKPGENGPLFFLLLRPWLQVVGQSEFALRFFAVFWGVLSVPLTWALARRLLRFWPAAIKPAATAQVSALAALLVATSPYLVWYSQEGKMYALVTALALSSLLALLWALTAAAGAGWRWLAYIVYIVLTSLGFYLHVMLVLLLPVHAVLFVVGWPSTRKHWRGALAALACFTLPYLPLVWWQWRLFASPTFDPGFAFVPLPRIFAILLVAFGRGIRSEPPIVLVSVWIFLLFAALLPAVSKPAAWRRPVILLTAWLLAPTLLLFAISLRVPLFNDRYLIYIGPAFYLLSAVGVCLAAQRSRGLAAAALLLALSLNLVGVWGQAVTPIKADLRGAAAFVQAQARPTDVLIFQHPYIRFTFAYYAGWDYAWREAPFTNDRQRVSPESTGEALTRLLQGADYAWLIESEAETWDRRGFNRQWLDAHGEEIVTQRLTGVQITRWALE